MKDKLQIVKKKGKELFNHIFIDGLTGMAWGLFSTLIIGAQCRWRFGRF